MVGPEEKFLYPFPTALPSIGRKWEMLRSRQKRASRSRPVAGRVARRRGLLADQGRNFIELGDQLLHLRDSIDDKQSFRGTLEEAGIGYRKAMYLISICEAGQSLHIPTEDLLAIGWTKAALIAPVLRANNWPTWIALAKEANTVTLTEMVKTKGKAGERKALVLPVKKSTHRAFYKVLQQLGARKSPKAQQWQNLD